MMETLGNDMLLVRRKIGYFASSKIASLSVLPTLDWAADVAKDEGVAVVSGFHSKLEREVLDFLLRGRCGIICVLARPIYKKMPDKYRAAYEAGRVLFISPFKTSTSKSSRQLCQKCNEYVARICEELVFSSVTRESSLYLLSKSEKNVRLL